MAPLTLSLAGALGCAIKLPDVAEYVAEAVDLKHLRTGMLMTLPSMHDEGASGKAPPATCGNRSFKAKQASRIWLERRKLLQRQVAKDELVAAGLQAATHHFQALGRVSRRRAACVAADVVLASLQLLAALRAEL